MNEQRVELVSALLDGELDGEQRDHGLDAVCSDPGLQRRWAAYSLIGDVMRADRVADAGLAARVHAAVQAEPELPRVLAGAAPPASRQSWLRPVAGLALAAGLATVAVLGGRSLEQQPAATTAVVASAPVAAIETDETPTVSDQPAPTAEPRTLQFAAASPSRLQWSTPQPAVQQRLNAYLVDYSDYLGTDVRGMLPYARVVGYDGRQP